MSTPDTSPQLSKCHQAPVELSGGVGDFSDSDRVMTMHYICTECKQPCDLYVADTSPGDELSAIVDKIIGDALELSYDGYPGDIEQSRPIAEAKDRLNRLMLTRLKAELYKAVEDLPDMKETRLDMVDQQERYFNVGFNNGIRKSADVLLVAVAAIDAQLNKEEK